MTSRYMVVVGGGAPGKVKVIQFAVILLGTSEAYPFCDPSFELAAVV